MWFLSSPIIRLGVRRGPPRRADHDLPARPQGSDRWMDYRQMLWMDAIRREHSLAIPARYDFTENSILRPCYGRS